MSHLLRTLAVAATTATAFTTSTSTARAQSLAGEYQVEVRGTTVYLDREPVERALSDNTTLNVEQQGDQITIEFRSFASAMSTTVFEGRVGNGRFVAAWTSASGDLRLITGEVDGRRLRGRLIYPRATADASVPGWTEVEFGASPHEIQTGQATPGKGLKPASTAVAATRPPGRPPLTSRPPGAPDLQPTASSDVADDFEVEVTAMTAVDAPLADHRIEFLAKATPRPGEASVASVELWVNGLVQGSADGNVLELVAGPFPAGELEYDIVAVSTDGRRSKPQRSKVAISTAGNTTIRGRIHGHPEMVEDVQLLHPDGRLILRSPVDQYGAFRMEAVPAGEYVIFVNDAKREARVQPSSNVKITVDGTSDYHKNFEVD
ncbi:MAG: hypothetical protein Q8W45_00505 [Candidatus Palauibacterales bacterium]|nr:hypothetical protein [Candidatus Palauibacterales bacterium]